MPPALTKQMLGLPRWAWVAVIAGGLAIGLIIRQRQNDAADEADGYDEDTGDSTVADVGAGYDPYGDLYATGGYPNEYYPAGSGSGYGYEDGYEYLPDSSMPDAVTPNVEITINAAAPPPAGNQSTKPCTKPKPTRPAGKGKRWECRGGKWTAVPKASSGQGSPNTGAGGSGSSGGCGPKPSQPAGHNKKWVCRNGKWVKVQKERAGGNSTSVETSVTGGGPPNRRNSHRPPPRARTRRVG